MSAAPCEANVIFQPAGKFTAPLPSGKRVGVSGGIVGEPGELGDGDDADAAALHASVSTCRRPGSVEANRPDSSYSTAAAGEAPRASETMTRPAIFLSPWVFAVSVKKEPRFWP